MSLLEAFFLGLIQGLTEFIPVSSSGHLVIAQYFFSGQSSHLFLEFVNIGTFLALLIYFRRRIIGILQDIVLRRNFRLARNILLTAIPAGMIGLVLSSFINESSFFGSIAVVAVTLALVGGLMIILEKLPKLSPVPDGERLGALRALIIGLAQCIALIPGVSRSGSTIITGRLMGMSAAEAAEYSFLASIPIMAGVTLKNFASAGDRAYLAANLPALTVANLAAFLSGLLAISFLLRFLSRRSLAVFGWYRLALAAVLFIILLVQ